MTSILAVAGPPLRSSPISLACEHPVEPILRQIAVVPRRHVNQVTTHVPPLLIPALDHARLDDWRMVSSALDAVHTPDPVAAPRRPHRVDAGRTRAYMN